MFNKKIEGAIHAKHFLSQEQEYIFTSFIKYIYRRNRYSLKRPGEDYKTNLRQVIDNQLFGRQQFVSIVQKPDKKTQLASQK